jgi:hypothetical protein
LRSGDPETASFPGFAVPDNRGNPTGVAVTPKGAEMSEFASEETVAADDQMETTIEPESGVEEAPAAAASDDEDWED